MAKRLHYIDWLRVLAVLLLVPVPLRARLRRRRAVLREERAAEHAAVRPDRRDRHLAHAAAVRARRRVVVLRARASGRPRATSASGPKRLLVPLLFGTLVIVPPQMWFGAMTNDRYTGSLLAFWPRFFVLRTDRPDYFGSFSPAHLWFILFLFFISLVALPLMLRWGAGAARRFAAAAARRLAAPAVVARAGAGAARRGGVPRGERQELRALPRLLPARLHRDGRRALHGVGRERRAR